MMTCHCFLYGLPLVWAEDDFGLLPKLSTKSLSGVKELPSVTIKGKREVLDSFPTQSLPSHLPLWEYCQWHRTVFWASTQYGQHAVLPLPLFRSHRCLLGVNFLYLQKLIDEIQGSPVVVTVVPAIVIMALLEECWVAPLTYKHHGEWHWEAKQLRD